MEKPIDLIVEYTKDEIIKTLHKSGLPITVMNLIVKDISQNLDLQTKALVNQQKINYQQNLEKEGDKNGNN